MSVCICTGDYSDDSNSAVQYGSNGKRSEEFYNYWCRAVISTRARTLIIDTHTCTLLSHMVTRQQMEFGRSLVTGHNKIGASKVGKNHFYPSLNMAV